MELNFAFVSSASERHVFFLRADPRQLVLPSAPSYQGANQIACDTALICVFVIASFVSRMPYLLIGDFGLAFLQVIFSPIYS